MFDSREINTEICWLLHLLLCINCFWKSFSFIFFCISKFGWFYFILQEIRQTVDFMTFQHLFYKLYVYVIFLQRTTTFYTLIFLNNNRSKFYLNIFTYQSSKTQLNKAYKVLKLKYKPIKIFQKIFIFRFFSIEFNIEIDWERKNKYIIFPRKCYSWGYKRK